MKYMVTSTLVFHFETNYLLSQSQSGFTSYRFIVHQVIYNRKSLKNGFENHESTFAAFVDFKSAYDSIWRLKLIQKFH